MNENLHNTPSEWLTFMLDGELDKTQEAELYSQLGNDPALQSEMNELIAISKSVKKDTEAFTPPLSATKNIFETLGINNPATSAASSNSAAILGVLSKFWKPVAAGITTSLVALLVFFNSDEKPADSQLESNLIENDSPAIISNLDNNGQNNNSNLALLSNNDDLQNLSNSDIANNSDDYSTDRTNNQISNNINNNINLNNAENNSDNYNSNITPKNNYNQSFDNKQFNSEKSIDITSANKINLANDFVNNSNSDLWQFELIENQTRSNISTLNLRLVLNGRSSQAQSNFAVGGEISKYLKNDFSLSAGLEIVNNPLRKINGNAASLNPAGYLNLGIEYSFNDFTPYLKNGIGRFEQFFTYKLETGISYNIYQRLDLNASFDVNMFITQPDNFENYIKNPTAFSFGFKYGI